MKIKSIAVAVCLGAVAVGTYAANYRYPSKVQAGTACNNWRDAGGTYDYIYQTTKRVGVGEPSWYFSDYPQYESYEVKVVREETKSANYRSCWHEEATNQFLGYQNQGEDTKSEIVKNFRY